MPFLDLTANTSANPKVRQKLLDDVVDLAVKHLGKPKEVTMARLTTDAAMSYAGTGEPAVYVAIRAIGLPDVAARKALVGGIAALCDEVLDVRPGRTFVVFEDVPADRWGAGGTIVG